MIMNIGPTDIEIMDGVFFRQSPSAVVLLKMSIVTEDDKWLQVRPRIESLYLCSR